MRQLAQVKREIVRKAGGTPGVGERPRGAGRGTGGGGPVPPVRSNVLRDYLE